MRELYLSIPGKHCMQHHSVFIALVYHPNALYIFLRVHFPTNPRQIGIGITTSGAIVIYGLGSSQRRQIRTRTRAIPSGGRRPKRASHAKELLARVSFPQRLPVSLFMRKIRTRRPRVQCAGALNTLERKTLSRVQKKMTNYI